MWGRLMGERGQMAVELAVLMPVVVVVCLVVYNLGRFTALCAAFDRISLDAVLSQGVAPAGSQTQMVAVDEVQSCIIESLGEKTTCDVEVSADRMGGSGTSGSLSVLPRLTKFTCTLTYRPWSSSFVLAGVVYDAPLALHHSRSLVVDRYSPGVVM